jgi:signal transduction histidine kinase
MLSDINNDTLACMVKSNPELETAIQTIIDQNKQTTSIFVHELRNPLSLLKGTIQYIEAKHPESKGFKYWNQLQDLVNDIEHMIVDVSLLNTYNHLDKEIIDLSALVDNVSNSFMPQAIAQQIELTLTTDPDCVSYFQSYLCDQQKLKQALSNLVKNAFEATCPGNYIHIHMSYLPEDHDSPKKLSLQISNNGSPIPEDEIGTIFTPFVTYKKGGTGVGLAVVKKIIDLHYGSIRVTSNENSTSFTILLPL